MVKNNKQKNDYKSRVDKVHLKQSNSAMTQFQNQEHNTQKEALGPNTKR